MTTTKASTITLLEIEHDDTPEGRREVKAEQKLLDNARYTFWCFPCGFMAKVSSQEQLNELVWPHKDCEFDAPTYAAEGDRGWRESARRLIAQARDLSRRNVKTKPDHAGYPNHYANDSIRDLFEEVIHE